MAEVIAKDGSWEFDGEIIRIIPGRDRGVHKLRQLLGEVAVPLPAVAGIAYEPGRKGGVLRLRLRDGACPLLRAAGGRLPEAASPYLLRPERDRGGVAEYFAEEVRRALLLDQVPDGPVDRYLLPGPAVPLTVSGMDGNATFDGEQIRVEWKGLVEEVKKATGNRTLRLADLAAAEWIPAAGMGMGGLRFRPHGAVVFLAVDKDPHTLALWGTKRELGEAVLLAAAVTVRLPHPHPPADAAGGGSGQVTAALPAAGEEPADAVPPEFRKEPPAASAEASADPAEAAAAPASSEAAVPGDDHDAVLRRLRELGELHAAGVLTDEEFAAAKRAILQRMGGNG
ncbi:Tat pathway signal sequence domain protein [Streptomyces sp. CNQ-509]|uniref:DUF4429 domain-containing protein n=1 Tax=unclassified Streptomyces TaxID=2593676 RepID=UPI00062DFD9D|nr:DUF4429 domain-containing protein [Streptomyces sp. CNQ-509]AKH82087.1 Tat pathway signal sequence domain protein [Streptomyces sp. CNQ-509]